MLKAELQGFSPRTAQDKNVLAYILEAQRTPAQLTDLYPAHLHINLMPDLQKGGHGSALLRHQLQSLRNSGVSGVHLGVDPRNEGVTGFYAKFGFLELDRVPSILMERGSWHELLNWHSQASSGPFRASLCKPPPKVPVLLRTAQQILVPPACRNTALIENDDMVGFDDGGQPMGHEDHTSHDRQ